MSILASLFGKVVQGPPPKNIVVDTTISAVEETLSHTPEIPTKWLTTQESWNGQILYYNGNKITIDYEWVLDLHYPNLDGQDFPLGVRMKVRDAKWLDDTDAYRWMYIDETGKVVSSIYTRSVNNYNRWWSAFVYIGQTDTSKPAQVQLIDRSFNPIIINNKQLFEHMYELSDIIVMKDAEEQIVTDLSWKVIVAGIDIDKAIYRASWIEDGKKQEYIMVEHSYNSNEKKWEIVASYDMQGNSIEEFIGVSSQDLHIKYANNIYGENPTVR